MNTTSINFQSFLDWDNSPFILFNSQSKILYLNNNAEMLFGYTSKLELYNLALSYAPQNFGYKTTKILLNYDSFSFYAITVGYECEDQISIRFYNAPRIKSNISIDRDKLVHTNINLLLEANIVLLKTKSNSTIKLLTDQDIPDFKIDQNKFSKLLRKSLDSFIFAKYINITLKLLTGEHVIIAGKRKLIAQLTIKSEDRLLNTDADIKDIATECYIAHILNNQSIKLEIPLIG